MVMAEDADRDRGRRRRRRGGRKEFERDVMMGPPIMASRPPIILAKPPPVTTELKPVANTNVDQVEENPEISLTTVVRERQPEKPPPILLKSRDDNHRLPHQGVVNGGLIDSSLSVAQPGQQVSRRGPSSASVSPAPPMVVEGSSQYRLAAPPEMFHSIKLVDDSFNWCEAGMEMLLDQTDFLVVGVIGMQGVGKSTILSHLANKGDQCDNKKPLVFTSQQQDVTEVCGHQTSGVDIYVSSERIIYLDCQPALSPSLLHSLIQLDKKYPPEYNSAENCVEIQSLQLASFMLTVCNVILVMTDWFIDTTFLGFLKAAEMLKPATPVHDGTILEEYRPQIVFVLNRANRDDFSVETYTAMQQYLDRSLESTRLKCKGGVTMATCANIPGLNKNTIQNTMNLYLLPEMSNPKNQEDGAHVLLAGYQGHSGFESIMRSLKKDLFAAPRQLLTHTTLSEKNWFHYAARTWDSVKKSQMFSEYNRLLP